MPYLSCNKYSLNSFMQTTRFVYILNLNDIVCLHVKFGIKYFVDYWLQ